MNSHVSGKHNLGWSVKQPLTISIAIQLYKRFLEGWIEPYKICCSEKRNTYRVSHAAHERLSIIFINIEKNAPEID